MSPELSKRLAEITESGSEGVKFAQQTLHHYLDIGVELVKNSNPTRAVTARAFYITDIINGQIEKAVSKALEGVAQADILSQSLSQMGIPSLTGPAKSSWDQIRNQLSQFYFLNDREFYVALPLAIPALEPKDFDLKKAILDSDGMQALLEAANVKFWIKQV